jgi:SH3-like domain-containing protein
MKKIIWLTLGVVLFAGPVSASTMQSIGKDRVNVRSNPNLNSKVLFQAYLGYPIQINKQQHNWFYCTDWKNNTGWIYKTMVSGT